MKIIDKIKQNKQLQKEMWGYLLVGILGTIIDFLIFYFAIYLGAIKFVAQWFASFAGFTHNHLWQHFKVFDHNQNFKKTYLLSFVMFFISVVLSAPLLIFIDNILKITWLSKVLVIGVNTVVLFIIRKKWIFINTKGEKNMNKLIFATHNKGKVTEMKDLLNDLDIEVLSAEEAGVFEDVIEDGKTLTENSLKKSRFVAKETGEWSVADDSGICIDALDGKPGVYSARWSNGKPLAEFTIEQLKDKELRTAYFASVISLVSPEGKEYLFDGKVKGSLIEELRGESKEGLPYDSIFVPEGFDETFAEMGDTQKNKLSHRGRAFEKLKKFICQEQK